MAHRRGWGGNFRADFPADNRRGESSARRQSAGAPSLQLRAIARRPRPITNPLYCPGISKHGARSAPGPQSFTLARRQDRGENESRRETAACALRKIRFERQTVLLDDKLFIIIFSA